VSAIPQNRFAVVLVAFAVSLALLPSLVAAEPFTLPSKTVFLESWEYWAACVEPLLCMYHNYGNAYTPDAYLVYRVLINPDGSEQIIDYAPVNDDVHNYYPVYYHSLSAPVPEKQIDLTEPGSYRVELRKIEVPHPTATHALSFTPDSVVDWWVARQLGRNPVPGADCRAAWGDNCWLEVKTDSDIKLSDKSVLLEYYEITVAAPVELPSDSGLALQPKSSFSVQTLNNPFEQNKGVAQSDDNKATAGMAVAGLVGLAAVGAGAYLYRSYSTQSGSSFNAYQTAAGKANDAAVLAEKKKIIRMDEEFAERNRQYNLKKQMAAQSAALAAQQAAQSDRSKQLEADLANIQNSKSYADAGSSYALLAAKYSDILTDDGKKQLMDASNQMWSANAIVTAPKITTVSYVPQVMAGPIAAKQQEPLSIREEASKLPPNVYFSWREFDDMGKPLTQKELNQLKNNPSIYWDLLASRTNKTKDQLQMEAAFVSAGVIGGTALVAFVGPELIAATGSALKGTTAVGATGMNLNYAITGTGVATITYLAMETSARSITENLFEQAKQFSFLDIFKKMEKPIYVPVGTDYESDGQKDTFTVSFSPVSTYNLIKGEPEYEVLDYPDAFESEPPGMISFKITVGKDTYKVESYHTLYGSGSFETNVAISKYK
jgi:hypothetical protein